ncbi:hypothetical protein KDX27_17265 [Burkholderia cenocepacia]|uniref:hypothetical protein n=1 Tax=Burkholderia cenocepacia TaxID=95486 RepID=UPI0019063A85|nr:hypothetical protein [Burkholderia cenocepacia]MBJ9698078.1 hypothetical protein [Burkholderia cenocepacia]MBN3531380.1 hypothetical protein [Burkholderia cenocepacia]MBO1856312.1 hypothetical protein [Burkholderia cenocepacia]MBR7904674.1 hypothetical protein [Burkholderia cenocepacia]MBR8027197.1 hypothetical protein [Burkholderia cenocepacia]
MSADTASSRDTHASDVHAAQSLHRSGHATHASAPLSRATSRLTGMRRASRASTPHTCPALHADVAHPALAPAQTKKPRRASGRGQRNNHHLKRRSARPL